VICPGWIKHPMLLYRHIYRSKGYRIPFGMSTGK
jgi:hypothetical protein